MSQNYIYLHGKVHLAKIVNGVPGELRLIGNVPNLALAISAETIEHKESMTGTGSTDFTMTDTTGVEFSGELEEASVDNIEYILSGTQHAIESEAVTGKNLGTVTAGKKIRLGGYNVTDVVLTAGSTPIDASKYVLDAAFGTVTFKEAIAEPVTASFSTGEATAVSIADNFNDEFELYFEGINRANKEKWVVTLHRTKKTPESEFPLIHSELGSYSISGQCLADLSKQDDPQLGLYGNIVKIPNQA